MTKIRLKVAHTKQARVNGIDTVEVCTRRGGQEESTGQLFRNEALHRGRESESVVLMITFFSSIHLGLVGKITFSTAVRFRTRPVCQYMPVGNGFCFDRSCTG